MTTTQKPRRPLIAKSDKQAAQKAPQKPSAAAQKAEPVEQKPTPTKPGAGDNMPDVVVASALVEMQHQVSVYHQALSIMSHNSAIDLKMALDHTEELHKSITDTLDKLIKLTSDGEQKEG